MILEEEKGFYKVTKLKLFRKTEGVIFDIVPLEIVEETASVDRVLHDKSAVSPGPVGEVKRPWYMHPHQKDNLLVLSGHRNVELYSLKEKRKIEVKIYPDKIYINGKLIANEGVMLSWDTEVFHRIISGENGSASLNFAIRDPKFDVKTSFNIYDLDEESGEYKVIREGFKDQV